MGPKVQSVEQKSQATDFSKDFIRMLQGGLDAEGLGTGVGPLQRLGGDAITRFLEKRNSETSGMSPETAKLIQSLTEISGKNLEKSSADLKEVFGLSGNRFSSSIANADAGLRTDALANLDATIGGILQEQAQFDVNSILAAAQIASSIGNANLQPFLQIASQGILPNETIVSPGLGSQLLSGAMNGLAAYLGGGGGIPGFGGGETPGPVVIPNRPPTASLGGGGDYISIPGIGS